MKSTNELIVDVNVNVNVPPETAKRCVDILNMYLKDTGRHPVIIHCANDKTRTVYYQIDVPLSEKPFND